MNTDFLPFSRPSVTPEDVRAVTEVLTSGWITTGKVCAEFEEAFAASMPPARAVSLTSATAGMHLALHALGIGPGDEVITPAMTWVSTVNLIRLVGATPVFADVDRDTLMVTAETLAPCLTEKTRLIVPVHFAGAAADMDPIRNLAAAKGVPVIEDAAHALGTRYKGRPVGADGTAIFSFHPIKNITTAEGGMFCSPDQALADHVRRLRFHGLGVDAFDRQTHGRAPQAEVQEPGFKYNLPDMCAALGLSQFRRLEEMNARRRALAGLYLELLTGMDEIRPLRSQAPFDMVHSWHLFVVRLNIDRVKMGRDAFMEALKSRGIGTGLHFRAAHLHRYYRESMGTGYGLLPNTEYNSDRILSLPLFPDMTENDVQRVVRTMKEVLIS
ncbi:MAG: UDP-4-amino-4-deoxy-L-arabinose aminotransferase [Deltaproteobacteria bacterium]|nr:UDP-4-amino-4-deoxy-L-arabinose aminotransferase [Deltaproteobacteria bacterium]